MRTYPESYSERKSLEKLNVEPWMVEALKVNPSYVYWGPYEDYMIKQGKGWDSPVEIASFKELDWPLDDMNEVVHFYFALNRAHEKCEPCEGTGYAPESRVLRDSFHGRDGWCYALTQDEVDALVKSRRMVELTHHFVPGNGWIENIPAVTVTPEMANTWARGRPFAHDSINECICVEARAKRLGLTLLCTTCQGDGYVYTAPRGRLELTLWVLHPRKGASRGIQVQSVDRDDLPKIRAFLAEAAARNAERFAKAIQNLPQHGGNPQED